MEKTGWIRNEDKRIIEKADKYARNKTHKCLFGGCKNNAIRCHAIPRSSCAEALADENQLVFTKRPSLSSLVHTIYIDEPVEIIEVGINNASIFKGYCGYHDTKLFAPAETQDVEKRKSMCISLHLRALSLEYCRKRYSCDFFEKIQELSPSHEAKKFYAKVNEELTTTTSAFKQLLLDRLIYKDHPLAENVEYLVIPFKGNFQVSCCGCFTQAKDTIKSHFESVIGYNLISHRDMSVLTLTTFNSGKEYLNSYYNNPNFTNNIELLLNDIAFSKGEEPLITPKLWKSLTADEQLEVRMALRHPMHRPEKTELKIIKFNSSNSIPKFTSQMLTKLPANISESVERINEIIGKQ